MLTSEGLKEGRVRVTTAGEYVAQTKDRSRADGRYAQGFDFALSGLCHHGSIVFPYPGMDEEVVMVRRDQAERLALDLLRKLNGGELPTDSAELVDFITSLGR
jgi:hypothetical protein